MYVFSMIQKQSTEVLNGKVQILQHQKC